MARANRHFTPGHFWNLKNGPERQEHFSGSIAVGSQAYIQKVRQALGIKEIGRRMAEAAVAGYQLKESACPVKFRIVKNEANLTGVAKYRQC